MEQLFRCIPLQCSPPRPVYRELIRFHVARVVRMAFDPFEQRLYFEIVPLLDFSKHILHNVFVLYRLPSRSLPSILTPVDIPDGDTVNSISTVSDDRDIPVPGYNVQST